MSVDVERAEDGLATLTVAAGPLNLYTAQLHEQFRSAIEELIAEPPRVLLIQFAGKLVSGGVDVSLFAAQSTPEQGRALFDTMLELPRRVADCAFPVVFAAHGLCLTWAFELALACDILLAAESASFGLVEKVIGLTPTMGGTQRLAARAGVGRAKEFVMTGQRYPATTMYEWNVVNKVLPDNNFTAEARNWAARLTGDPTMAHAATKQVLRHYEHGGVAEADAQVTTIAASLFETEDLRSGIRSFLENGPGKATFNGR